MNIHQRLTRYWISGLISGASKLIGGVISEHAADKRAQLNREAQKEENQLNRDWQEMMYNKYESPAAQQQQMLAAGLNPMGAVSPQSVGSASTSSLPTNSGPGAGAGLGSAIQETIPAIYEAAMSQRALRQADLEATATELDNWKKAFDNGNAEELYEITKKEIESRTTLNRYQSRVKKRELRDLDFTYKKAKEAYEQGFNEYVDAHNASVMQNNKILSDLTNESIRVANEVLYQGYLRESTGLDNAIKAVELNYKSQLKESELRQAQLSVAILYTDSEIRKLQKDKISSEILNDEVSRHVQLMNEYRNSVIHEYDVMLKQLEVQGVISENALKEWEATKARVQRGDYRTDSVTNFMQDLQYDITSTLRDLLI